MPKEEIAKCVCGGEAEFDKEPMVGNASFVICSDNNCWIGPIRRNKREAIKAWNRVMGRVNT